jgi:2'-5' RNA ligase
MQDVKLPIISEAKGTGYSIWLIPENGVYRKLSDLISQLSREHNTPSFDPHVTLIGGVLGSEQEVVSKTDRLASIIKPYKVGARNVEYLNEYFKCLFLRVKETDEVVRANSEARKVFGKQSDLKYMPHLSLMYGNLSPQAKEQIIAKIGREIPVTFDVNSIRLFSTNGRLEEWYEVENFPLE